jgi:hypothetical protein
MRLLGHGHPEIRATHGKTFELVPAAAITGRATCVIAVGARPDGACTGPLAGPLRLEVRAGGRQAVVRAVGNPGWTPGGSAVVRRSDVRLPGTLATEADTAAADLPADLVAALRDPATAVELSVSRDRVRPDGRADLVLLWTPAAGAGRRLPAELAAAWLVVAEDEGARRLVASQPAGADLAEGSPTAGPGTGSATAKPRWAASAAEPAGGSGAAPPGERSGAAGPGTGARIVGPADTARIAEVLAARGRVLVVSTEELPGASVPDLLAEPDTVAVEVAGLPGPLAVAAASPSRAPLVLAGPAPDLDRVLRETPAGHRLVVEVAAARLPTLLGLAAEWRGSRGAVLARQPYGQYERPRRIWLDRPRDLPPDLPTRGTVLCCLDPAGAHPADPADLTSLDPTVRGMLTGLLADQVPTRTAARALAELTGWSRRQAYQAVLDLAGHCRTGPDLPEPHLPEPDPSGPRPNQP